MRRLSLICKWRQWFAFGLLALFLLFPAGVSAAAVEIMPVDQIKTGMHGIAKTVVAGSKIDEFGVEVLGIMKDKGPSGDLILVRVYGDLVEHTGIAQGMSGSPVYIDGKLVGAIAYGWSMTDHKVGMITPITDMLKLWDLPSESSKPSLAVPEEMEPVATPLMAAGFSENALNMLRDKLKAYNLVPYAVGTAPEGETAGALEPGSAVGVELVRGDVSLGALGTVTYVEGDKVLAFGHPFLKKGLSNYFMTKAHVFTTVQSFENSFKVGVTGDAVGMINQDRGAGISGQLNKYPDIVPMRIIVRDNSTGLEKDAAVQIVQDEQLSPVLAATTAFNVIEKTLDRVGAGTARVSFEIMGRDLPGDTIRRENMFYTAGNIGELAVAELHEGLTMLFENRYHPVDIMDIKVNIGIDSERKTAYITEARANTATAKPGDTVEVTVKLKPYRGETITKTVSFVVPKNQPAGLLTLEVRGGGMAPLIYGMIKNEGYADLIKEAKKKKQRTFDEVVKEFVTRDRNNDLVVEALDIDLGGLAGGEEAITQPKSKKTKAVATELKPQFPGFAKNGLKAGEAAGYKQEENKGKFYITTDYIIEGDTQIMVQVVSDDKSK